MSNVVRALASSRAPLKQPLLELWAGPECTVNRVHDRFLDQFAATGHCDRPNDLDLLAGIGLSAIRYPVSWERIAPDDPAKSDWGWTDERLAHLRGLNLRVIAGLVHHGSGPRYTDLLSDGFATGLAAHAGAAAERYPWIEDWTPVNEPLTTARFSALYGYWYPHLRDERAFWLALLNQIDATRLAMRQIRRHVPGARLVQTEDLGRTYATAGLADQAAFDNSRRWMTFDLLCGLVVPRHVLWPRLCEHGFKDRLRIIADDPCPPATIGINHYLTSDRLLDHRRRRYPGLSPGSNGRHTYVDTEAVRALSPAPSGLAGAIREAWERYGLPLALTEIHNGSTRDEQMRWLVQAWDLALEARGQGVDVRAVTSWATFGSSGWNTLLTRPGRYEPGAFDTSGRQTRATALVPLLRSLASFEAPRHPVLHGPGWWQREIRWHHPKLNHPACIASHSLARARPSGAAPLLIVGATGTLGRALAAACRHRHIVHALTGRAELDLADAATIEAALERHRPWAVINAAGWVRVDDAEANEAACFQVNTAGAERIAAACAARSIPTVSFSSDLAFAGRQTEPYDETHDPDPLNAYGRSKAAAERKIAVLPGQHLLVRTAAFFSPFDRHNFAVQVCRALAKGMPFAAPADQTISPTYVPDLCDAVLDLIIDGEAGLWHLTNETPCTWADFAQRVAQAAGLDVALIEPRSEASFGWAAVRPTAVPLVSRRGKLMPSLDSALQRFAREWRSPLRETN